MIDVPGSFSDLCLYREALRMNEDEWLPVEFTEGALLFLRKLGHDLWAPNVSLNVWLSAIDGHREFLRRVASLVLPPEFSEVLREDERLQKQTEQAIENLNFDRAVLLRNQRFLLKRKFLPFLAETHLIASKHIEISLRQCS